MVCTCYCSTRRVGYQREPSAQGIRGEESWQRAAGVGVAVLTSVVFSIGWEEACVLQVVSYPETIAPRRTLPLIIKMQMHGTRKPGDVSRLFPDDRKTDRRRQLR